MEGQPGRPISQQTPANGLYAIELADDWHEVELTLAEESVELVELMDDSLEQEDAAVVAFEALVFFALGFNDSTCRPETAQRVYVIKHQLKTHCGNPVFR